VAAAAMAAATMTIIFAIFKRFGLTCPVGRNGSRSKTEAMFFPPPGVRYEDTDLSPIAVDNCEITFTNNFKWLGSMLDTIFKTKMPLNAGSKARTVPSLPFESNFSAQKGLKNSQTRTAYEGLILSILLYGCETWSLTKQQQPERRLQIFYNSGVRAMCRVSMCHFQEYKSFKSTRVQIFQVNLELRLLLEPFDTYPARRWLTGRWADHVSRMLMSRLPRLLLSAWVDRKRPQQLPQFTYGHGLKRDLSNAVVDLKIGAV
jgi:hypothetical protein